MFLLQPTFKTSEDGKEAVASTTIDLINLLICTDQGEPVGKYSSIVGPERRLIW